MSDAEATLEAAESVATVLQEFQVDVVVIGAIALAAHHYVRYTENIDLGINTDLATLHQITDAVQANGFRAELREPGDADPLSGVVDVSRAFGWVRFLHLLHRLRGGTVELATDVKPLGAGVDAGLD